MSFNRALAPAAAPDPDALTSAMVGIGMNFAAPVATEPALSVAELARRTYASFATAWMAKRDFMILSGVALEAMRS